MVARISVLCLVICYLVGCGAEEKKPIIDSYRRSITKHEHNNSKAQLRLIEGSWTPIDYGGCFCFRANLIIKGDMLEVNHRGSSWDYSLRLDATVTPWRLDRHPKPPSTFSKAHYSCQLIDGQLVLTELYPPQKTGDKYRAGLVTTTYMRWEKSDHYLILGKWQLIGLECDGIRRLAEESVTIELDLDDKAFKLGDWTSAFSYYQPLRSSSRWVEYYLDQKTKPKSLYLNKFKEAKYTSYTTVTVGKPFIYALSNDNDALTISTCKDGSKELPSSFITDLGDGRKTYFFKRVQK